MKQFLSRSCLAAILGVLPAGVGPATAGSCGPAGCGVGLGEYGYENPGFNRAWLFPDGGYTVYPGQPGSCFPSHSDYSKLNWTVPPTLNAQGVLDKLRALGVPQVPPETIYLGKNPRAAEDARLPTPRGWAPKEVEPKEAEPKGKDIEKPKVDPKDELKDKSGEKKPDDE